MTWIRKRALGLVYRDDAKSFGGYTLFCPVRDRHADLLDSRGRKEWTHLNCIEGDP